MADVDIPISAGSGTLIRAYQRGAGDYDQYVRAAFGTAKGTLSNIPWSVTTAGIASAIAADTSRVGLIIVSAASAALWVRFDSTIPTSATYDWLLNPGDRWEVPHEFVQLAQSWAGSAAGGVVLGAAATCA